MQRHHRWVLQADLRLYFPSVDLTILRAQLAERIACSGTLWLLDRILANGASFGPAIDGLPGDTLLTPLERPRGLPIGNLTSQFLANLHLDRFDHRTAALPGIEAYLRYVDDFALFADSPRTVAPGPGGDRSGACCAAPAAASDQESDPPHRATAPASWAFTCCPGGCGCATTTCSRAGAG